MNISAGTPTSLTLAAGTYWLAWQWNSANAGPSYTLGSANSGDYLAQAYGAFPASWTGGTLSTENWSLYATYAVATTTTLTTGGSPQTYGAVTLSATVSPSAATGPVTFMDGSTTLGSGTLSGGTATFTPTASQLPVNGGTAHSITAVYGGDSTYAGSTSSASSLTINAKALTVTGLSVPASKVYDGTIATAATSGTAALQDTEVAGSGTGGDGRPYVGDTVTISGSAAGSYNLATVSGATTVTFSGLSSGNANYTLTAPTQAATITRKPLTVTGLSVSATKVYDGGTTATPIGTPTLLASETASFGSGGDGAPYTGDTVLPLGTATASYNSATVAGASLVTFGGLSTANGNYSITPPTYAATITRKGLTVTGITASSKVYDGTPAATLNTGSAALSGNLDGGNVTLSTGGASGAFADASVANGKTVTVSGLSISGAASGNYTLTQPTTTANITGKTLTVAATGPSKTYGTALTTGTSTGNFSAGATGVGSESVTSVTLTPDTAGGSASTAAGTAYTVTPSLATGTGGFSAANYNITYTPYNGTVGQAALTVTATGPAKTYGTALTTGTSSGNFTASATQNGETVTSVTLTPNAAGLSATTAAGLGYTVTPSLATGTGGFSAANYNIAYNAFSGTVGQAALTVTAAANTKQYDGTTSAAATPTGNALQNGDVITSGESYDNANVGTTHVLTPATVVIKNSGLTVDETANYNISTATINTGVIQQRTITVTAAANSKQYDGTTSAAATPTGGGALQNGDVITSGESYDNANVGTTHVLTPATVVIKNSTQTVR